MRALALVVALAGPAVADPCAPHATTLVVETAKHAIVLCERGAEAARFPVSIGTAGTGKTTEGDHKTPLGSYPLAAPKSSTLFGRFLAIGYPTPEQKRRGLTGSDIGIHGPPRSPSPPPRERDWTEGCVAVGDDVTIEKIATWVTAKHVTTVELR